MIIFLVILSALLLAFAVYLIILHNNLVIARNKVQESFSSIDVYLKMRFDLVPNLVECVKAYTKHEKQALAEVIKARASMQNAVGEEEKVNIANEGIPVIKGVFALAEKYPNLKADTTFKKLQKTLEEIEENLSATRRFYNTNVTKYNNKVKVFPNNLFVKMLKHKPLHFFKIKLGEEVNPVVFKSDKEVRTPRRRAEKDTKKIKTGERKPGVKKRAQGNKETRNKKK